jgi:phosphatidylserine/phosphatidylglycerophosphate/cardiolipin synthase-like enzyme
VGRGPLAHDFRVMYHQIYALWEHFEAGGIFESDPEKFKENHFFSVKSEESFVPRFDDSPSLIETPHIKMFVCAPCKENPITQEYIRLVKGAKKEIKIANFYFNPIFPLFEEIRKAVRRGIHLHLITNGKWEHSPFYCNFLGSGNRVNYVPILFGHEYHFWQWWEVSQTPHYDTRIFEFEVPDVLYHKKVMVVDQRYTIIGSYNLNLKSDYGDFELVLVIDSEPAANAVLKVLEKDRTFSREISREFAIDWYFDPIHAYEGAFQKLFQGFL